MPSDDLIFFGTIEINEGKQLVEALKARDVHLELVFNESECRGSCQIKVQLWGHESDLPELEKYISSEKSKLLDGLNFDPENFNNVFDPAKETAKCPACTTEFSTSSSECPECGLTFFIPEDD
jgi:hypothetical protein